tara:strand:+ start:210 stop:395 length:186 start_codon:yes stop_codon:yes gene_type:complete
MAQCWAGTMEDEGHLVNFSILEDDTVIITEFFNFTSTVQRLSLDEAIDKQQTLTEFGYAFI